MVGLDPGCPLSVDASEAYGSGEATGVFVELDMSVEVEDVGSAWGVIEPDNGVALTQNIPHHGQSTLGECARAKVIDIGNHEPLDAFSQVK